MDQAFKHFPSSKQTFPLPWAQPSSQWSTFHTNTLQRLRNSSCRLIWNPDLGKTPLNMRWGSISPEQTPWLRWAAMLRSQLCTFLLHFLVPEGVPTPQSLSCCLAQKISPSFSKMPPWPLFSSSKGWILLTPSQPWAQGFGKTTSEGSIQCCPINPALPYPVQTRDLFPGTAFGRSKKGEKIKFNGHLASLSPPWVIRSRGRLSGLHGWTTPPLTLWEERDF